MCEETCENVEKEVWPHSLYRKTRTWKMIGQYRCTEIKKGLKMRVLKLTVKPPVLVLDVTVPDDRRLNDQ